MQVAQKWTIGNRDRLSVLQTNVYQALRLFLSYKRLKTVLFLDNPVLYIIDIICVNINFQVVSS